MHNNFGIILAFIALFGWGFADFLIQRTVRKIGIWKPLFFIGLFGLIFLLPFVFNEIGPILFQPSSLYLLLLLGVVGVISSLFDFEALKQGKMAVVEPLIGIELPITVGLSIVLGGEHLNLSQAV